MYILMSVFLFYITESTNVCNYTDNTAFHTCDLDFTNLINRLDYDSVLAIGWFEINYVKINKDKSHFFYLDICMKWCLQILNREGFRKVKKKLFGGIEKHPKFEEHILKQCKKTMQRLRTFQVLVMF